MISSWLKLFRAVNLPTVPGDVLAGAAAVSHGAARAGVAAPGLGACAVACAAAVLIYMFGLADNDIVGAKGDGPGRPIPAGEISMRAARWARFLCLFAVAVAAVAARLPLPWWAVAGALVAAIVTYNRTKWCLAMGACRGLNVVCGGAALMAGVRGVPVQSWAALLATAAVWTLYVAAVTKYSEGEECDDEKRRRVGFLVGAIVYLQLVALILFGDKYLLVAGAAMLVALRVSRRAMPGVSAS